MENSIQEVKLFINGQFRESSTGDKFQSFDPSNGELVANVHRASSEDINAAVTAAKDAFYSPQWRDLGSEQRSALLLKIAELIKERKHELIELEIKDSGSTRRKATADIHNTASFFKVMSKVAKNFVFEEDDQGATRPGFSKNKRIYEPVGVCAQIIPWNFPLVMAGWKLGPILATGCTCVLKTAEETPSTAYLLAQIIKDAGVPDGVINIITGGAKEGQELIAHKDISKVAFTGSTQVGREILKNASDRILNSTLELGGKSANIILEDADLDVAVDGALYGFLYHSGQACDSGTRILVQESIYDQFLEKITNRIKDIKVGLTSDNDAGFGPLVSQKQLETVMGYINKTKSEGAKLLAGGNQLEGDYSKGFFVEPTLFEISPDNTIWHEEIFGPVAGITKFKTDDEAIALANHSEYGLAGAVWSKDLTRAEKVAAQLETGTVWLNEYHLLNPGMPFGGYKQSGLGREMGREGMLAYLEVKHLWESDCDKREDKVWYNAIF